CRPHSTFVIVLGLQLSLRFGARGRHRDSLSVATKRQGWNNRRRSQWSLAEGVGFEPTRGLRPWRVSRPPPLTPPPPFRMKLFNYLASIPEEQKVAIWHPIGTHPR